MLRRKIVDGLDADFLLARRLLDGSDERLCLRAGGKLADDEHAGHVRLGLDEGAHLDLARAFGVARGVHDAALREVRQNLERLALENGDLRLDQLAEVVR